MPYFGFLAFNWRDLDPNWVIALLTFVIAIVGYFQWRSTQAAAVAAQESAEAALVSANVARDTLHISQRAYLSLVGFELGPDESRDRRSPVAVLRILNSGHQPATIAKHATMLFEDEEPPANPADIEWNWQITQAVAPPGQVVVLRSPFPDARYTPEHWRRVRDGEISLSVYGIIHYDTGFPEIKGETAFGQIYDHTDKVRPDSRRFAMALTPGYNYSK